MGNYKVLRFVTLLAVLAILTPVISKKYMERAQQNSKNQRLLSAIRNHDVAGVKHFLDTGADPDFTYFDPSKDVAAGQPLIIAQRTWTLRNSPYSPLFDSAERNTCPTKIVEMLVLHGANVNRRFMQGDSNFDKNGISVIGMEALFGNTEAIKFLAEHGARPQGEDLSNINFMLIASVKHPHRDYAGAMAALLDNGLDANAVDRYGSRLLISAAKAGDLATVRLLLAHGANPELKDHCGDALSQARTTGHATKAVLLLLQHAETKQKQSTASLARPRSKPQ